MYEYHSWVHAGRGRARGHTPRGRIDSDREQKQDLADNVGPGRVTAWTTYCGFTLAQEVQHLGTQFWEALGGRVLLAKVGFEGADTYLVNIYIPTNDAERLVCLSVSWFHLCHLCSRIRKLGLTFGSPDNPYTTSMLSMCAGDPKHCSMSSVVENSSDGNVGVCAIGVGISSEELLNDPSLLVTNGAD